MGQPTDEMHFFCLTPNKGNQNLGFLTSGPQLPCNINQEGAVSFPAGFHLLLSAGGNWVTPDTQGLV